MPYRTTGLDLVVLACFCSHSDKYGCKIPSSSQSVPFSITRDVGLNNDIPEKNKMLRTEAENVKSTDCGNYLPDREEDRHFSL